MTTINTAEQAHDINTKGLVTVYFRSNHEPKTKLEGVNYIQLDDARPLNLAVSDIVGSFKDKVSLTPLFTQHGNYLPHDIGVNGDPVGMTVVTEENALALLGRKRMTEKTRALARSILWGVNRKSFT